MITITAFEWVPDFAQGQVRDLRVRWALKEAGLAYRVRLIDARTQASSDYRAQQPFGQVPVMVEDGRALFETGAILLNVAERGATLLPRDDGARWRVVQWMFAALNSVEPCLADLAVIDFFTRDEEVRRKRRPDAVAAAHDRLAKLEAALGDADYLVGGFTVADLLMATVLRIADYTNVLAGHPRLAAYKGRCIDRPAFKAALAEQMDDFEANTPARAAG